MDELARRIRSTLREHADPERAVLQQAYMKSAMPFLGLGNTQRRTVLKPVLDEEVPQLASHAAWESAIRSLWDGATHREERYAALQIARHRAATGWRSEGALALYRHLIESGAWWDLVDEVATHLVRDELLAAPPRVAPIIREWAGDPHLWVRRAAILSQIGARQRTDPDLLADVIVPNLERAPSAGATGRQDFFIRKAIGWALRDHARLDPDWVERFVDDHRQRLAGLTIREALRGSGGSRRPQASTPSDMRASR